MVRGGKSGKIKCKGEKGHWERGLVIRRGKKREAC
jgi:hypothetical protein